MTGKMVLDQAGLSHLWRTPDAVSEWVASNGHSLGAAMRKAKAGWRALAEASLISEMPNDGLKLQQAPQVPTQLRGELQTPASPEQVRFATCHDTLWSRRGQRLRAQMMTSAYPAGDMFRRHSALLEGMPEDSAPVAWKFCQLCATDTDTVATVQHLLLRCPGLDAERQRVMQRVRNMSMSAVMTEWQTDTDLPIRVTVLAPQADTHQDWVNILLGGCTVMPIMTAAQARRWPLVVPDSVPDEARDPISLACSPGTYRYGSTLHNGVGWRGYFSLKSGS